MVVLAVALLLAGASVAAAGIVEGGTKVAAGRLHGFGWRIGVKPYGHRDGICLGTAIRRPTPLIESGQCSAPAPHKGIVVVTNPPARAGRHATITVVAGAFNAAVAKIEVTTFAGAVETLVPEPPGAARGTRGSEYRYLGFAVPGPWCARTLTTYDVGGDPLWEAEWRELNDIRPELLPNGHVVETHDPDSPALLCLR
jgi:hypothetical protein